MKKLLLLIAICSISTSAFSQFPMGGFGNKKAAIKGFIAGELIDSLTNQPVAYATIVLKKEGSDKEINGVLSEDDGKFRLTDIPADTYDMYISFLGYNEKMIKVETTPAKPDLNMDPVFLRPANYVLDQVEITDQRALTEMRADKIVYNAEQDASITGGDATEVLRKVPLLSVDYDGNVSLRGSQNLRILINGKPSGMFSSNVADALKMIPADEIKQVEVITTPSAKYDAEGAGGIINIITKKKTADGYSGSVSASVGNRQNNATASLNGAKGRFGVNANGSVFYSNPADAINTFTRIDTINSLQRVLTQEGTTNNSRLGFRGTAGMFYDFNAYNSINTSFSTRGFSFDSDGTLDGSLVDPIFNNGYSFVRESDGVNGRSGYDWSTDYKKTFEEKDREFTVAFQLSGDQNDADNNILQTYTNNIIPTRDEQIFNDGNNLETTFQADYVHPLPKGMKLEVGAKTVLRNIDSDYTYSVKSSGNYVIDPIRSNAFNYSQNVVAGYASMTFLIKKFSVIAGVRYERTAIEGDFEEGQETVKPDPYQNILPNLIISRSLKNFQTLKLSYNQRIQRPSLSYINPFQNSVDSLNIQVGNPTLTPEIVHQVDLSYNTFIKGFGIFSSLYYKYTEDIIQQLLTINDNGVGYNTFENIGVNNSYGVNIFTTKNVNAFTFRGGFNLGTFNYSSKLDEVAVTNPKGYEYNVNFGGSVNLPKDFKIDFFGFLRSPRFTIQGKQPNFSIYGMGIKKEFPKIKASIGIRVIEPFNEYKYFNSSQSGNGFNLESSFGIPFRSVGLSFDYRFGNLKFKERKTSIKNNDLMQGGDGQQQQGGAGGSN